MPSEHGGKSTIGNWKSIHPENCLAAKLFSSVDEFRNLLVAKEETFVRCLTKKLLTYAIGRQLNGGDRPAIDRNGKGNGGFRQRSS